MENINIFKNKYATVPEDRLTYCFFTMLHHLDVELQKDFINFLITPKLPQIINPFKSIIFQESNEKSRTDASFKIECENGHLETIHFENKTYKCNLALDQLNNHYENCKKNHEYLLVISPRLGDEKIVKQINYDRLIFKTWSEVLDFLKGYKNKSSLISDFLEFAWDKHHLMPKEIVTENDILKTKSLNYPPDVREKFDHLFIQMKEDKTLFTGRNIDVDNTEKILREGRHGIEFHPSNKEYGQWFFYGIYFDSFDHKLEFKSDFPELTFFVDCMPNKGINKEILRNNENFMAVVERLTTKYGFEENLIEIKANPYRILFKRIPLDEFKEVDLKILTEKLNEILDDLTNEKAFRQTIL